jgi:Uma2 family endonuclease
MSTRAVVPEPATSSAEIDWSYGWREKYVRTPDGELETIRIPLTEEEALHPKLGYIMPERTEHDFISDNLCDMWRAHFENQPEIAVFRNLIFEWDRRGVKPFAPDVAVVPNVVDRDRNRSRFVVASEGARPCLVVEVVSRNSRKADRVTKVRDYARVGVPEYVYIDVRTRKGKTVWEIAGFRLEEGHYLPILPDEDDAIFCETIGMRIGVEEGKVWLEDANTGENLLTNLEAHRARRAAEVRAADAEVRAADADARATAEAEARVLAETRAELEAQSRRSAEARLAELEAELRRLQEGRGEEESR